VVWTVSAGRQPLAVHWHADVHSRPAGLAL